MHVGRYPIHSECESKLVSAAAVSHVFLTQEPPETTHSPSPAQTQAVALKVAHVADIGMHAVGDVTKFAVQVDNQALQFE